MIVDTSALLAWFNDREPQHARVGATLAEASNEPLVVSPFVVAELDYLLATKIGIRAELAALAELSAGGWELPAIDGADLAVINDLIARYADQAIGAADASMVVLAARYRTRTIATLDRRHFGVLRPLDGGRFTVVP